MDVAHQNVEEYRGGKKMAVDRGPVLKKCRTLGISPAVLGLDKKVKEDKSGKMKKKLSEYGLQLKEKQKAKFIYGILEKPFRNYFAKAEKMKGQTGENLMISLERRLDNVIFRSGLARTRRESRQVVGHKHVLVNGKIVNIPSYQVSAGDKIEITESAKETKRYKEIVEITGGRIAPAWIDADLTNYKATIKNLPARADIDVPVNEMLIVELYSK